MKKAKLDVELNKFLQEENAEELFPPQQADGCRTVFDYGDIVAKEISFVPEESMNKDWLWDKVHIQSIPAGIHYNIDFRSICDFVFAHVEREMFTTLDSIFFLFDESGLEELYDYTGDDYALECLDMDRVIGLMWYEKNIILINVGLIQKTSEEIADEFCPSESQFSDGIVTTLVHELRHLMLDTNVLLSEEDYPYSENAEDAVEEFTRQFADRWLLGRHEFVEKIKTKDKAVTAVSV